MQNMYDEAICINYLFTCSFRFVNRVLVVNRVFYFKGHVCF
jgi:hypothetical protein